MVMPAMNPNKKDFFKDFAREKPCLIRIASTAGLKCAHEDTTSLCHFELPGYKAMGSRKASLPDIAGAWGCSVCHDIVDFRLKVDSSLMTRDEIRIYHAEGVFRTIDALVRIEVLPNP